MQEVTQAADAERVRIPLRVRLGSGCEWHWRNALRAGGRGSPPRTEPRHSSVERPRSPGYSPLETRRGRDGRANLAVRLNLDAGRRKPNEYLLQQGCMFDYLKRTQGNQFRSVAHGELKAWITSRPTGATRSSECSPSSSSLFTRKGCAPSIDVHQLSMLVVDAAVCGSASPESCWQH